MANIVLYNTTATTLDLLTKISSGTIVLADLQDLPINEIESRLFIAHIYNNSSAITEDIDILIDLVKTRLVTTNNSEACQVGEFNC